jgi:hypothetical protein
MSEKQSFVFDVITTAIGGLAAVASTLDTVEQWCRIFLLLISIISGSLLVLVNWRKGIQQIKDWIE